MEKRIRWSPCGIVYPPPWDRRTPHDPPQGVHPYPANPPSPKTGLERHPPLFNSGFEGEPMSGPCVSCGKEGVSIIPWCGWVPTPPMIGQPPATPTRGSSVLRQPLHGDRIVVITYTKHARMHRPLCVFVAFPAWMNGKGMVSTGKWDVFYFGHLYCTTLSGREQRGIEVWNFSG